MEDSKELRSQIIKFTSFGIIALLADLGTYTIILNLLDEKNLTLLNSVKISKTISFIVGTTVTYYLNKKWTWGKTDKSKSRFVKFLILYSFSLIINVSINSLALLVLIAIQDAVDFPLKYLIAFIAAAGTSAVFTFFGQKFWVFKDKPTLIP